MKPMQASQLHRIAGLVGVAAIVAACGGGVVAVLPFVAAIGGFWQGGVPGVGGWVVDPDETLDFAANNDYFVSTTVSYPATLTSKSVLCGPANNLSLVARFDGANFTLSVPGNVQLANCMSGVFEDEITLRLNSGGAGTRFRNATVASPDFQVGLWQNINRTGQGLRFRSDATTDATSGQVTQTGCEITDGTQTGAVVLRYTPGNPATDPRLKIDSLAIKRTGVNEVWGPGRQYGLSGMQVGSSSGGTLSLQRIDQSPNCS